MFGKEKPPALESIESYIDCAYELRLDLIDFRRDRGFDSKDPSYLFETKMNCLQKGFRWAISPRSATSLERMKSWLKR